jgi:zinc D-Ala-D-Ala dipeptidase
MPRTAWVALGAASVSSPLWAPVHTDIGIRTVTRMTRPLSSFDYRCFLDDPDRLEVPVNFVTRPLPELVEPSSMPSVAVPAALDHEPMVPITHRNIRVLQPYYHVGWNEARPGAFVRSGVAERVARVAENLPTGFGLAVLDAWRPLSLQAEIYDAAYADSSLPEGFVSQPSSDPATPPPHLTGGCLDVTLTWQGRPLALGSAFDDFTDEARADAYEGTPGRVRQLRRLLYWAMRDQDFIVIDCEWWHYEIGTRRWGAITDNTPFYGAADIVLADERHTDRYRIISRPSI